MLICEPLNNYDLYKFSYNSNEEENENSWLKQVKMNEADK